MNRTKAAEFPLSALPSRARLEGNEGAGFSISLIQIEQAPLRLVAFAQ
jgi:hypothetical protein